MHRMQVQVQVRVTKDFKKFSFVYSVPFVVKKGFTHGDCRETQRI